MTNVAHIVIFNMRSRAPGISVRAWSKKNGFCQDTVYKVIQGRLEVSRRKSSVSGRIRQALVRDGFWPSDDQCHSVSSCGCSCRSAS